MCGEDPLVKDKPYLYFAVPYTGYFDHTTCVEKCPAENNDGTFTPSTVNCHY